MNIFATVSLFAVVLAVLSESVSSRSPAAEPGPAAFLFEYRPKAGLGDAFDAGYRRHLAWHEKAGDPLSWLAWYVTTGERAGMFIDGTFGISFEAFDGRVDPSGDGADFDKTVAPLAEPAARLVYRVRPDLSTGQTLERGTPPAALEVTRIVGKPGSAEHLEQAFASPRQSGTGKVASVTFTFYELVAGGEQPQYMLMIPRRGWQEYDVDPRSGLQLLLGSLEESRRKDVRRIFEQLVGSQSTETWSYRPDLSLLAPGRK